MKMLTHAPPSTATERMYNFNSSTAKTANTKLAGTAAGFTAAMMIADAA